MKCYCLIQTEKTPCQYLSYRSRYAQIPAAERGTEPLTNSRKHGAGKMKTWKKSHNSTRLFQTKVCTTENIHLHRVCIYMYICIYVYTHLYVYVASCLPAPALCNCSLTLPALDKGRAPLASFSHLQNYYLGNQFWHFGQILFPQHNPAASTHSVLMHFYTVPTFLHWSQTQSLWLSIGSL